MCGIAGVMFRDSGREPDPLVLARMSTALAHRGPDGDGTYSAPGVGLVHRRLAIIDPAGAGQPLGNEDNSIQITFNGEIYNFRDLRAQLATRGHHFRTESDTEVLVHLYEEYGEGMVEKLRGMFAFALWDSTRGRLFLARDRVGIKPLYYYRDDRSFWFGSEPRAILSGGACAPDVDPQALDDYLAYGMVIGPGSIYRGVEQLPPAHWLVVDRDHWRRTPRRYWSLKFDPDPNPTRDWAALTRAALDDAVRAHMVADVAIGAFLSGGVDSSAITASMAIQSGSPPETFVIRSHDSALCEGRFARMTADQYGTHHREEILSPDVAGWLGEQTRAYDEPLADPSTIPTLAVARLASRFVKVALSGDGGDEAFGGYPRYVHDLWEDRIRRRLPGWVRRRIVGPLAYRWPHFGRLPRPLRMKTALTNLALEAGAAYANTMRQCRLPLRHRLISASFAQALRGRSSCVMTDAYNRPESGDALSRMTLTDLSVLMPDNYLVKIDRAGMYYGLEVRPPLLDHKLLEFAATIPSTLKIRRGSAKWVLKKSQEGRVPVEILARPKQGFVIPVDEWLQPNSPLAGYLAEVVFDARGSAGRFVDTTVVRRLYSDHMGGRARHGRVLWSVLVLVLWGNHHLSHSSYQGAPPVRKASPRLGDPG